MSLTLRRGLSWALTLASLASLTVGITHLPGAGGAPGEIRWLLGRDGVPSRDVNRAVFLVRAAEENASKTPSQLLRSLLSDKDPRIVSGALAVILDWQRLGETRTLTEALDNPFGEWFRRATTAEKVAQLPRSLGCFLAVNDMFQYVQGSDPIPWNPTDSRWRLPATDDNLRWLVAATLLRGELDRVDADVTAFSCYSPPSCDIITRLRLLDGLPARKDPVDSQPVVRYAPILPAAFREQLWMSVNDLVAMLSDPIDQVRWGAGRILAVAGDERGLPAFCDWLQHNPRFTSNANKLMTDLFGPDWRTHCASGSRASQPGQRDGGG